MVYFNYNDAIAKGAKRVALTLEAPQHFVRRRDGSLSPLESAGDIVDLAITYEETTPAGQRVYVGLDARGRTYRFFNGDTFEVSK